MGKTRLLPIRRSCRQTPLMKKHKTHDSLRIIDPILAFALLFAQKTIKHQTQMWKILVLTIYLIVFSTITSGWMMAPLKGYRVALNRGNAVTRPRSQFKSSSVTLSMMSDQNQLDDSTRKKIEAIINNNNVVLFMKGTKVFPQW